MTDNAISNVFAAFIEADKAMKELPAVKDALEKTQGHLNFANAVIEEKSAQILDLANELAVVKETLANREAELASTKFRHEELASLVSSLRGILVGGGDGNAHQVTPATGDEVAAHTIDAHQGERAMDPTVPAQTTEDSLPNAHSSTADNSADVNGQSSVQSGHANAHGDVEEAQIPFGMNSLASNSPASTTELPIGNTTFEPGISENPSDSPESQSTWIPRQYHDTAKPDSMLWGEWLASGGPAPYWMDEAEANWHKDQHLKGIANRAAE